MKAKKRIGILAGCLLVANVLNATCTINPLNYSGRVVSGSFGTNGNPNSNGNQGGRTSMAMFRGITNQFGGKTGYLDVYTAGGTFSTPWQDGFDVDKITDRVVSLDLDSDGEIDDIAAIYDNGGGYASIHTWRFVNTTSVTHDDDAWYVYGYDATKVTGRVVSGDFDCDQLYDDIAAFYDYGAAGTKIHVWLWNHVTQAFSYQWWWEETQYTCNAFTGRVVSGDFDQDGVCNDIATLYDNGGGSMHIHMFKGKATIANYQPGFDFTGSSGWWSCASGYTPSNISFRVASGNFDHSGLINHKMDDIVAIYDYGNSAAKAHVWTSTGNSFVYSWKWEVNGFNATSITKRFVTFDTDAGLSPERSRGMAALYNYGTSTNMAYHWQAWKSGGNWGISSMTGYLCPQRLSVDAVSADATATTPAISVNAFPNPSDGHLTVEIAPAAEEMVSLMIVDLTGREVLSKTVNITAGYREEIDLSAFGKGVYILRIVGSGNQVETKKLIVE